MWLFSASQLVQIIDITQSFPEEVLLRKQELLIRLVLSVSCVIDLTLQVGSCVRVCDLPSG